jgi:hypothetical protein
MTIETEVFAVESISTTSFCDAAEVSECSAGHSAEGKFNQFSFERSESAISEAATRVPSTFSRLSSCTSRKNSLVRTLSCESWGRINSCEDAEWTISAEAIEEECKSQHSEESPVYRYTVQNLLSLRHMESAVNSEDIEEEVLEKKNFVSFRKNEAKGSDRLFNIDRDVDVRCIVDAYNLGDGVKWFQLKTFCEKKGGVAPLAIRMSHRKKVPSAMIIFETVEKAATFQANVSGLQDSFMKGRIPRFQQRKRDIDA